MKIFHRPGVDCLAHNRGLINVLSCCGFMEGQLRDAFCFLECEEGENENILDFINTKMKSSGVGGEEVMNEVG